MTTTTALFIIAAVLILASTIYAMRRRTRPVEHSTPRPTVDRAIVPLHSRLQPGDVVSIHQKSGRPERGTRETVFMGRSSDGRLIFRTTAWCRTFRRPVGDVVSVVRTAAKQAA